MVLRIYSAEERCIILKFWDRPILERKFILDVMTDLNEQIGIADMMVEKGILVKVSLRFYKLSISTIQYLIEAETYNKGVW